MSPRFFVSQAAVERWSAEGRADLAGGALVAQGGALHGCRFELEPAVRVLRVAGAGEDPHQHVGRVRPVAPLREGGAELLGDSLVVGEVAYEVEPGFLAVPDAGAARLLFPGDDPSPPAGTPPEGQGDAASLARFLLDNIS